MSGHSKWSTIKRQKGVTDAKRSNVFTKLAKIITVASRTGHGLDIAIEQAKKANMPHDNIDRAIARGKGELGGAQIEEEIYEAYLSLRSSEGTKGDGPSGVAIMIRTLTDNKNRTVSEIRAVLNKFSGSLASTGAVSYLFEQKGIIEILADKIPLPKEDAEMIIIDSGADDFVEDGNNIYVYTPPKKLEEIKESLEFKAIPVESAKIEQTPKTYANIAEEKKEAVIKLLEALEDLDDVSEVFTNADL